MNNHKNTQSEQDEFFDAPSPSFAGQEDDLNRGRYALNIPSRNKKRGKIKIGHVFLSLGIAVGSFFAGYFTYAGLLDKEMRSLIHAKQAIDQMYYMPIDNETFYGVVFDAINHQLLDPYSAYMTVDEYSAFTQEATGKWSGLGLTFSTKDENGQDQMLITRVSGNSPAEAKGILEGDKIVGFGQSAESCKDSVSFTEFSAFLEGYDADQEFVLKIRSGEQTSVITIAKTAFVENYVFYRSQTTAYSFVGEKATEQTPTGNVLSTLPNDTAYIRLTQFHGSAAEQFASTMSVFKQENKKNLVLDLRGNGGGYMNILCDIAAYFCKNTNDKKPLVAVAIDKDGKEEGYKASKNVYREYFSEDSRICVLADSSSASASECLLGAMIDHGAITYSDICLSQRNGVAKTFGKGIMQMTFPFGIGKTDAIKLTTARICWPVTKNCIHDRGILPTDGAKEIEESYQKDAEIISAITALGL